MKMSSFIVTIGELLQISRYGIYSGITGCFRVYATGF